MTTIKTLATAFVTLLLSVLAAPANASDGSITIRITDRAAVESSIGACDAGYALRDVNNAGSRHVVFTDGSATLRAPIAGEPIAPMFTCAGAVIGFPSSGIDIEVR